MTKAYSGQKVTMKLKKSSSRGHLVFRNQLSYHLFSEYMPSCCSVAKSCLTLCSPMDCSTPGFPVLHYLPKFAQTQVHRVGDAIQPSHPMSSLIILPSIFPSIRALSHESALHIKWPRA